MDVVFARGTGEPPGPGRVGQSFVDALRGRIGARSLTVHPVDYPARSDFDSAGFAPTVVDGIRDAGSRIQSTAANCPNTRVVLGGYSQGAAVVGYLTSASVTAKVHAAAGLRPMPPELASHVAAVALFGTPSADFLSQYDAPPIVVGPLFQPKTLRLCAPGDGICGTGDDIGAHASYDTNGMADAAAAFAAGRL